MKILSDKDQAILVNWLANMSLLTTAIATTEDKDKKVEFIGDFCQYHCEVVDLIAGCKGLEMTANIIEMCAPDKKNLS